MDNVRPLCLSSIRKLRLASNESFIEQAIFAIKLEETGFQAEIGDVLAVDKGTSASDRCHARDLRGVLIYAIGAAHDAGRRAVARILRRLVKIETAVRALEIVFR